MKKIILLNNGKNFSMSFFEIIFISFMIVKLVLDFVTVNGFYIFSKTIGSVMMDKYIISWITYFIQVFALSYVCEKKKNLSSLLLAMLFLLNGVGYYTLYSCSISMADEFFFLINIFWLVFTISISFISGKNHIEENVRSISKNEFLFFYFVTLMVILISSVYGNFRLIVSFDDVYAYRMNLHMPTLIGYGFRFLGSVFLPFFFIRFLTTKRYLFAAVTFFLGLLLFSVDGLKTNLVLYFVVISIYVINIKIVKKEHPLKLVSISAMFLSSFVLLNYCLYILYDEYFFLNELHRVLIIPCEISTDYYDFIVRNEALLLRESIMRFLFESPYLESINYIVTDIETEYGEAVANTGMIGDAYANFKFIGIVIYPILYSIIIGLWQRINYDILSTETISIGFILLWNSVNISFFTWLLTGGVIVYFIIVIMNGGKARDDRRYYTS